MIAYCIQSDLSKNKTHMFNETFRPKLLDIPDQLTAMSVRPWFNLTAPSREQPIRGSARNVTGHSTNYYMSQW